MIIVLIRHGHKGSTPISNPELTEKGHEQSLALAEIVQQGRLPKPTHCWFSDKIRTQQTLSEVIVRNSPVTFEKPELSTRHHTETSTVFRQRVQNFLTSIEQRSNANEVHFICTHYDWIEEALTLINSDKNLNSFEYSGWSPAQFLVFEVSDGTWKVGQKGVA